MNRKATSTILLSLGILAGCASMPKVKVGYLLPKAAVEVTLTQTPACTDNDVPILKNDLAVTTTYSADRNTFHSIDLSKLGNAWSKANSTFEFYDDGRLKSVNTQQTGRRVRRSRRSSRLRRQPASRRLWRRPSTRIPATCFVLWPV